MSDTADRLNQAVAGRYTVEREIGQGGMATVYLARDVRHDRRVALKLLRPDLGAVVGVERFLAEIRVTANLQHPNLLPLFDSGAVDGTLYYVMPYVDGESLRNRLDREKQLPVDEAVRIAVAVAGALDYAHRQGVIHRDLKPENILIQAGQPVVADFGIALAISNAGGTRVTQTGLSLGTPQYMSPEQATGDRVIDARTDIYSLGALLYEMLTGDPPHTGSTAQAIIARMLTERPRPVRSSRPNVPIHVELAVDRALEKLPADRFATAGDFAEALMRPELATAASLTSASRTSLVPATPRETWRRRVPVLIPWFLLGITAGVLVPRVLRAPDGADPVVRFTANVGDATLRNDASPAISPDGSMLAFPGTDSARRVRLFLQTLDRESPVPIGNDAFDPNSPFFSPDGRSIGFVRAGKLWKISVAGGASEVICDLKGEWQLGSWSVNDDIVFGRLGDLYRVRAEGGEPQLLVKRDSVAGVRHFGAPHFLPDGKVFLAERLMADGPELVAVRLSDGMVTELGIEGFAPHYVDGGWLVYVDRNGAAFAVPFDASRVRVRGTPTRVVENVVRSTHARMAVSRNGTIAYLTQVSSASREVILVDRAGVRRTLPVPIGRYRFPRFSPDGRKLALVAQNAQRVVGDVWTHELATRRTDRLTFDSATLVAEWVPGGRSLIYTRRGEGQPFELWRVAATGGTPPESVFVMNPGGVSTPALTPDGKTLVYSSNPGNTFYIYTAPLANPNAARLLNEGTATSLSPDGRWIAYSARPSGDWQVYVRRLDESTGRWLVSAGGGTEPRWGANGREIFYRDADSLRVVSFLASSGADPVLGAPRALFAAPFTGWPTEVHYDVTADGQQFVFVGGTNGTIALNVVLNRIDQLRKPRN